MNLPPLPEPAFRLSWRPEQGRYTVNKPDIDSTDCHTNAAMREYGELCRREALEDAAKAIESTGLTHLPTAKQYEYASLLSAYATYFRELLK